MRRVLAVQPDRADVHNRLGGLLAGQGRFQEALQACRDALRLAPDNPEVHANLGNVHCQRGDNAAAVAWFEQALRLAPDFTGARLNLGNALRALGAFDKAAACYRGLIEANPDFVEARLSLCECYLKAGEFAPALACYDAVLAIAPGLPLAQINRGFALGMSGRYQDALEAFAQVLQEDPRNADAWFNRGLLEKKLGRFDAASASFRQALALAPANPEIQQSLGLLELLRGNFADGWRWYGARKSVRDRAPVDPSDLAGTLGGRRILLAKDQGIGDEIFFLRFARLLKERGAWLCCQTDAKIRSIVARLPFLDQAVAESDRAPEVHQTLSVGDLPRLLGLTDASRFPPPAPLSVLPALRDEIRAALAAYGAGPFVGLTWWAGTKQPATTLGDRLAYREVPLRLLADTLRRIDATPVILQRAPETAELTELSRALEWPVADMSAFNDDLERMLALLEYLDDYVGVDNTNMHLSAGIGKPCRILVPHPPEWRMTTEGASSPWFPGSTLYRQRADGDWSDALARLAQDVAAGLQRRDETRR